MWSIIIISLVILLIFIFYFLYHKESNILFYFLALFPSISIGAIVGTGIALSLPSKVEIVKTTYNLETLQDNNNITGSFFLGSGKIEGNMMYVFYYENNGFYQMKQVNYNKVKIKYTNENPKVEILNHKIVEDALINKFTFYLNQYEEYILHVPKETIIQNYSLDAK